jgi:hypothetical protein
MRTAGDPVRSGTCGNGRIVLPGERSGKDAL